MAADTVAHQGASRRRLVGLLLVMACVAAFVFTRNGVDGDDGVALPVTHSGANPARATEAHGAVAGVPRPERVRQMQLARALASALKAGSDAAWPLPSEAARRSWEGPPQVVSLPAAVAPESDSAPTAPEPPFQWVGLWEEPAPAGAAAAPPVAIIAASRGTRLVRTGDLLDEDWKVDKISNDQVQLTYLPSGTRQALSMNKK